ncbi:MAG: cysteine--tRNA ligase, partial [Candidatus Altiarchaeota archaeon]|nr:cysteine--tRNA ligase [Candidatus Altiarchaeota archaeon]
MDEDFNTPKVLASLFEVVREMNVMLDGGGESRESLKRVLEIFDEVTGVLGLDLKEDEVLLMDEEMRLIRERNRYRLEKNWVEADRIRDVLLSRGIRIVDRKDGSTSVEMV